MTSIRFIRRSRKICSQQEFPTLYYSFTAAAAALDHISVYDWIESRVPGGHGSKMGQLLDIGYNVEYGAETTELSALDLVYLLGYQSVPGNFHLYGSSDERYHQPAAMNRSLARSPRLYRSAAFT